MRNEGPEMFMIAILVYQCTGEREPEMHRLNTKYRTKLVFSFDRMESVFNRSGHNFVNR